MMLEQTIDRELAENIKSNDLRCRTYAHQY